MAMIVGERDTLGDPEDNEIVKDKLTNLVYYKVMENHDHISLYNGRNMTYFDDILQLMGQHGISN